MLKMARKSYKFEKFATSVTLGLACFVVGMFYPSSMAWAQLANEGRSTLETSQSGINARIDILGSAWRMPSAIGTGQSRIVVYRRPDSALSGATSVFIDGQYHTSLVPGGYSELCYAPGAVEVGARQARVGRKPKDPMDTISALTLQPGQTHYLRMTEHSGAPVMQPVAAATAQQEATGLRYQVHTISRVSKAQTCSETAMAATPVQAPSQQIALATDALFEFARADQAAITPAGQRALDKLVQQLRTGYIQIDHIQIVGHADPLGTEASNNRLAEQRANTVREYLLGHGLQSARITSQGRGAREPVVTHCASRVTPAAIQCNQPNRRVVVDIWGTQR